MNHSESLQRYQVILAAKHGIPLTILGIALQTGFNSENFFTESLSAYSAFFLLSKKETKIIREVKKPFNKNVCIKLMTG